MNSTGVSHPEVVNAIADQAAKFIHTVPGPTSTTSPRSGSPRELASIAPIEGRGPDVLCQFGDRDDRSRDQALAPSIFTKRQGVIAFFGKLSRSVARRAVADGEQGHPAARLRAVHAGRATTLRTPTRTGSEGSPDHLCGSVARVHPPTSSLCDLVSPRTRSPRSSSNRCPGRGRLCRAAGRIPPGAGASWRRATASCSSWTRCSRAWDGRGNSFASDHFGLKADIVNIAKGIASGLPLGVTCARADVMTWPPGQRMRARSAAIPCRAPRRTRPIRLLKESASLAQRGERGGAPDRRHPARCRTGIR